ncbi:MAG: Co2+/Mg2+ efflux protein ApaG [Phycisphaeraceae bacterium]|nr:Co2+/Mg2+ efflux protein ApaG [Phycisphaeraceae bacterium]
MTQSTPTPTPIAQNALNRSPAAAPSSERTTHGVRVSVWPSYLPDQSDPADHKFVFAYRIRITNESAVTVRLESREWTIIDADGDRKVVRGEGVVGQRPLLGPGQSFEYSSLCPLETSWGTMEGHYRFRAVDPASPAEEFDAQIGRFLLVGPRGSAG